MKKLIFFRIVIAVVILILSGCGSSPEQIATMTAAAWTVTPSQTATPAPFSTFSPTPSPTITPTPLPTFTPTPVVLSVFQKQDESLNGDIFANVEGNDTITNLTEGVLGHKILIGWSPNKQWILFGRYDGDTLSTGLPMLGMNPSTLVEIWAMRPNGVEKLKVLDSTLYGIRVSWSGDSERFITDCLDGENPLAICIVQISDFSVTHTGFFGESPDFSPDGKYYIWKGLSMAEGGWTLNIAEENSQQSKQIAHFNFALTQPIWSNDSLRVYVCNYRLPGNKSKIYYVNIDGTLNEELATMDRGVSSMAISPKGDRLLLFTYINKPSDVYGVIKTDGKGLVWFKGYTSVEWQEDNQLAGTKKDGTQWVIDSETGKATQK